MSENSPKTSAEMEAIARAPNLVEINKEIRDLIIDYAIGAAILGLNPLPGTMTVTLLAASVLLLKMMRDIGAKWGYPKGQDALAIGGNLFGGVWVLFGQRLWLGYRCMVWVCLCRLWGVLRWLRRCLRSLGGWDRQRTFTMPAAIKSMHRKLGKYSIILNIRI